MNFIHPLTSSLQGRCYWSSAMYTGPTGIGLVCAYENNNQGTLVASSDRRSVGNAEANLAVLESRSTVKFSEETWDGLNLALPSVRLLAELDAASYYVGRSTSGDICLITELNDGSEVTSSHCTDAMTFNERGIAGLTESASSQASGYLLPDLGAGIADAKGLDQVTRNLFVADAPTNRAAKEVETSVTSGDGQIFRFPSLVGSFQAK